MISKSKKIIDGAINEMAEVDIISVNAPTYPNLAEWNPDTDNTPKRGRGRPKGSKNKSKINLVESSAAINTPSVGNSNPQIMLAASIAEEVMRKIEERRRISGQITEDAKKQLEEKSSPDKNIGSRLAEGVMSGIEEKRAKSEKITKDAMRDLGEDMDVISDVRESTEALMEDKQKAEDIHQLNKEKNSFEKKLELAQKRKSSAVSEAEKIKINLKAEDEALKDAIVNKQKELERIRKKYAQYENSYSLAEKEKMVRRSGQAVGMTEEGKKGGNIWDKLKSGWKDFWTQGRK